jgi:hypothetical protein
VLLLLLRRFVLAIRVVRLLLLLLLVALPRVEGVLAIVVVEVLERRHVLAFTLLLWLHDSNIIFACPILLLYHIDSSINQVKITVYIAPCTLILSTSVSNAYSLRKSIKNMTKYNIFF